MNTNFQSIDSHNSFLTNKEMAFLSVKIDELAMGASQTLRYDAICSYFYACEHYYSKLQPILSDESIKVITFLQSQIYKAMDLIEADGRYRNRKMLKFLLKTIKEFYFTVRDRLQREGKYYFRTSEKREKGLGEVRFDFEGTHVLEGEK